MASKEALDMATARVEAAKRVMELERLSLVGATEGLEYHRRAHESAKATLAHEKEALRALYLTRCVYAEPQPDLEPVIPLADLKAKGNIALNITADLSGSMAEAGKRIAEATRLDASPKPCPREATPEEEKHFPRDPEPPCVFHEGMDLSCVHVRLTPGERSFAEVILLKYMGPTVSGMDAYTSSPRVGMTRGQAAQLVAALAKALA